MVEGPSIGFGDPLFQLDPRAPAHLRKAADIHEPARGAVGFVGIGDWVYFRDLTCAIRAKNICPQQAAILSPHLRE